MLVCWYISVDLVFGIGKMLLPIIGIWVLFMVIDVALSVNTIRIVKGKSLRNRGAIIMAYLRNESYLDVLLVAYII
jgi:hypothetical protein